jgi:hypothetical protein
MFTLFHDGDQLEKLRRSITLEFFAGCDRLKQTFDAILWLLRLRTFGHLSNRRIACNSANDSGEKDRFSGWEHDVVRSPVSSFPREAATNEGSAAHHRGAQTHVLHRQQSFYVLGHA